MVCELRVRNGQYSIVCSGTVEIGTNVRANDPDYQRQIIRVIDAQNVQDHGLSSELSTLRNDLDRQIYPLHLVPSRLPSQFNPIPIAQNDPVLQRPRIGVMGDSITEIGSQPNGYIGLLQRSIPRSRVEGHGIVGNHTGQMLHRFNEDILSHRYNIVIIEGGVNDLPAVRTRAQVQPRVDGILSNIETMVRRARESGAQVIVLTVGPWSGYPTSSPFAQDATRRVNERILALNDPAHGVRVVDLSSLGEPDPRTGFLRLRSGLSLDHLHPINGRGNHGQSEVARVILQQAFGLELAHEPQQRTLLRTSR